MAGISVTDVYDGLLTTTLRNYRKTLVDNIFEKMNFLNWLLKKGQRRTEDGGVEIIEHLMYGKNDTVKFYEGYETLAVTPQEGLTIARYRWAEAAGVLSISRREQRQNSQKNQLLNLLKAKTKQLEMSMKDHISTKLFANITAEPATDIFSILNFNQVDPTTSTTVGGINQNTYSWWRNGQSNVGAYANNQLDKMRTGYNTVAKAGQGAPDFVLSTQTAMEYYEALGDTMKRFPLMRNDKATIDLGFEVFKYKGADMFWDPDFATNTPATGESMIIGKSSALSLVVDKESDFIFTDFVEPENQTAKSKKMIAMLQLTSNNRRCSYLLHGIDAS